MLKGDYIMIGCLILHGYTGGPHEIEPLANYLKGHTNWDIYVPTLPGHGKKLALDDVSYDNWIEAAENNLKQIKDKYDEIYLIGYSMGGMIAAYLAAKYQVSKLVLLAPAGKVISIKQMTYDIGEAIVDSFKGKIEENKLFVRYRQKAGNVPFKANIELLKLVRLTRSYLKDINVPVFIAQGQQDAMVPAKTIYYLAKEIPSEEIEVVLFDQSDHYICHGSDKDTLNQMVLNFLKQKRRQSV